MPSDLSRGASRVGQPALAPIPFEGKRYEQVMNGERVGQSQRTGLMAVRDLSSGDVRYVKIYDYPRREGKESDVGDVFFTRFQLDAAAREIIIESERGDRFVYSIDTGSVRTGQP